MTQNPQHKKERHTAATATGTNPSSHLQIAQPSPISMPALERQVRLAGEVKNQQNNEPHQVNERQTVAITGWTMFAMPEPRDGLMIYEAHKNRQSVNQKDMEYVVKEGHPPEHEENPP